MADSSITKRALATALRELMEEVPFDKIQVAHICERCDMNRKSFYYHFKDKYDLLNWIFDTEFITFAQASKDDINMDDRIELLQKICNYFHENRRFYRKALNVDGQNSFSEHFREYILPLIKFRLTYLIGDVADDFAVNFFADAGMCAIERWLSDKNCMPPEQFVSKLMLLIQSGADAFHNAINQRK